MSGLLDISERRLPRRKGVFSLGDKNIDESIFIVTIAWGKNSSMTFDKQSAQINIDDPIR